MVACSVLKQEIMRVLESGELDAETIFVNKYFHDDYTKLEKNLRLVVEHALQKYGGKVVLVYGDLCLGMKGQMRKLAEEYDVVRYISHPYFNYVCNPEYRFSSGYKPHNSKGFRQP